MMIIKMSRIIKTKIHMILNKMEKIIVFIFIVMLLNISFFSNNGLKGIQFHLRFIIQKEANILTFNDDDFLVIIIITTIMVYAILL